MEPPVLSDANQFPGQDIVFSHLGKTRPLWIELFEHIDAVYPDFEKEWRYYRDGKSWLMKITKKKKTVFWLSVIDESFRTTFYFTDKVSDAILSCDLSSDLKEQFKAGKGKLKGVTVVYRSKKDVEAAKKLIGIKLSK